MSVAKSDDAEPLVGKVPGQAKLFKLDPIPMNQLVPGLPEGLIEVVRRIAPHAQPPHHSLRGVVPDRRVCNDLAQTEWLEAEA